MSETWHGIPRSEIPWYPTIDPEKCINCGKCVNFCHMKVFATEGKNEKKRTVVKKPNSCIIACTGCDPICPKGAIKHPSKKEFQEKIRALRRNSDYLLKKTKIR